MNSPAVPSELGARLRAVRMARGLGLREVARRLELSASSISQIETGKSRPSVRTLYALASEFGVTVDEFLPDEPGLVVQRTADRPAIQLNSGVRWERLMLWPDEDIEFRKQSTNREVHRVPAPRWSDTPGTSSATFYPGRFASSSVSTSTSSNLATRSRFSPRRLIG